MNAYNWTELAKLATAAEPAPTAPLSTPEWVEQNLDAVNFVVDYEGTFSFLLSMKDALKNWGKLTDKQLAAVRKCMDSERTYKERQAIRGYTAEQTAAALNVAARSTPLDELDLSKIPSGRYAVPGGTRLKVQITQGKGKWQGFTFVKDAAEYGRGQRYGMQRPGQSYEGMIRDELKVIASDPAEASRTYGRLVGRCGVCGRPLEDEVSVANGIGPICAGGF